MELTRKRAQENLILRSLPAAVLSSLLPSLALERREIRSSIYEPDKPIRFVYFVLSGVVSVVANSEESKSVEVATIGREGFVGLPAFLGGDRTTMRAFVQIAGEVLSMGVPAFRGLCAESAELTAIIMRYTQAFISQVAQSSACNRMHPIEERCARWLLQTHDRVDGDTFTLTHEFLATMLGVRRASVSGAASGLQDRRLIEYERGEISILDRRGLEKASCDCYEIIAKEYGRLLGFKPHGK